MTDHGPVVLFMDSTNPVTREQVKELLAAGHMQTYTMGNSLDPVLEALSRAGHHLLIDIPVHCANTDEIEAMLGPLQPFLTRVHIRGLVLCGGDTVALVARVLKVNSIVLEIEVREGIPRGCFRGGTANGLPVVTKAGGFGGKGVLCTVVKYLSSGPGSAKR